MKDLGDSIVVATGLRKMYRVSRPPREAIRGVSLTVESGDFVAIMGPSGSGKSTLLHILGGLEPPDQGSVVIQGVDVYGLKDEERSAFRRDHVGVVFQFFNLLPTLTAAENVALPLRLRNEAPSQRQKLSRQVIGDRVDVLMDQLNLHGLQGHGPEEISGGEQQRVALARALAASPALLLADEPTGNLDWTSGHEVMALLTRLCRQERQTAVLVTHDARVAAYADRVLIMRDGEVVDDVALSHAGQAPDTIPDPSVLVGRLAKLDL
ncbi:MAG: ABC transporter ATP-binding protein [Candidatus Dormiibacterota bacterium]